MTRKTLKHFLSFTILRTFRTTFYRFRKIIKIEQTLGAIECLNKILEEFGNLEDLGGLPFLNRFGLKNQNYLFKFKFGVWINSSMLKQMVMLTFSVLAENTNLRQVWSNKSKDIFKLKFGAQTNFNVLMLFFTGYTLFRQILSKTSKLSF